MRTKHFHHEPQKILWSALQISTTQSAIFPINMNALHCKYQGICSSKVNGRRSQRGTSLTWNSEIEVNSQSSRKWNRKSWFCAQLSSEPTSCLFQHAKDNLSPFFSDQPSSQTHSPNTDITVTLRKMHTHCMYCTYTHRHTQTKRHPEQSNCR